MARYTASTSGARAASALAPRGRVERHGGERHELGAGLLDARAVGGEVGLGKHVVAEVAGAASGLVLRLEHHDGVALARELVGGAEAAEAGADHGDATRLLTARRRRRRRVLAVLHRRALEVADADRAAHLLAHAGELAGGLAAARDHVRERHRLA